MVAVDRVSHKQVQAAQKVTPTKSASSAGTSTTTDSKQGQPPTVPMEIDADQSTQVDTTAKGGGGVIQSQPPGGVAVLHPIHEQRVTWPPAGKAKWLRLHKDRSVSPPSLALLEWSRF